VIASRTETAFGGDGAFPNRWFPIKREGGRETPGKAESYAGGACYVKITRLGSIPGALLAEAHFAFAEPHAWFESAPILKSKIGVVAQDRVRSLRRDLAGRKSGGRSSSQNEE
jgi:hypothetical protein